jgi:hypothetical protein
MCAGRDRDKGVNRILQRDLEEKEGALLHVCQARAGQRRRTPSSFLKGDFVKKMFKKRVKVVF